MSETSNAPQQQQLTNSLPKKSHHGKLSEVKTLQEAFDHPSFLARVKQATPSHLSPTRMLSVFIQSVQKTPKLMQCNIMSLLGAYVALASLGLEPNTPLQHAHLVPFEKRKRVDNKWITERVDVQVIIGYQGLLDLSYRSGLIASVHSDVVWAAEAKSREHWDFHYGTGARLLHRPMGAPRQEGELPAWAYMHGQIKGGGEAFEVMPIADVLAIRDATQAYRAALAAKRRAEEENWKNLPPAYTEAPWVRFPVAMIRKTVFRQGSKWLPKSIELARALALDEMQERQDIDYGKVIEGSVDEALDNALPPPETNFYDGEDFGGREAAPQEATQGRPADVRTATPTKAAEAPHASPSAPEWQGYLVDADGEIADDVFTAPEPWARAFAQLYRRETGGFERRAAMVEHNAEVVASLPQPALDIVQSVYEEVGPKGRAEPDPTALLPLSRGARGPDVNGWLARAGALIAELGPDELLRWVGNNAPAYQPFPQSKRLELAKLLDARSRALKIDPPVRLFMPQKQEGLALAGTTERKPETVEPPFEAQRWADELADKVNNAATQDDLKRLADEAGPFEDKVRAVNGHIWTRIMNLFQTRQRALRGES